MITLNDYCRNVDLETLNIELESLEIQQTFYYDHERQERINELYSIIGGIY